MVAFLALPILALLSSEQMSVFAFTNTRVKIHGIGISIINWIEQWISDRRQRVVVDGEV